MVNNLTMANLAGSFVLIYTIFDSFQLDHLIPW